MSVHVRQLLRREVGKPPSAAATLALALAAVGVLLGLMALAVFAPKGLPGRGYYHLTADFRDAKNLTKFADVRLAGNRVGQVTSISARHGIARVALQMKPGFGPLRSDTRARIRLKGLLGAKYVELVPGRRGKQLADGATLPLSQTSTTVELFDVLNALDARRRADLGSTVRGLGAGFLGRGDQLNAAVAAAPTTLRDLDRVSTAILARHGAAQRFFPALQSAAAAYDPVRVQLAQGFDPQARSLQPFVDRERAVQDALTVAPPALNALRRGLARDDPLLRETAAYARATLRLTRVAPPALRGGAALLRASDEPLRRSRDLLRQTSAAVDPTLRFLDRIDPLIAPSARSLRNSTPGLAEIGRRGCDLVPFMRNWRSALGYGIPSRHEIGPIDSFRIDLVSGAETIPDTPRKGVIGRDRYPAPCVAGTEGPPHP
jgi:virulence factor Mce-like protein